MRNAAERARLRILALFNRANKIWGPVRLLDLAPTLFEFVVPNWRRFRVAQQSGGRIVVEEVTASGALRRTTHAKFVEDRLRGINRDETGQVISIEQDKECEDGRTQSAT